MGKKKKPFTKEDKDYGNESAPEGGIPLPEFHIGKGSEGDNHTEGEWRDDKPKDHDDDEDFPGAMMKGDSDEAE
jgi:hypothetical protein